MICEFLKSPAVRNFSFVSDGVSTSEQFERQKFLKFYKLNCACRNSTQNLTHMQSEVQKYGSLIFMFLSVFYPKSCVVE